jgi:hypothetical protein
VRRGLLRLAANSNVFEVSEGEVWVPAPISRLSMFIYLLPSFPRHFETEGSFIHILPDTLVSNLLLPSVLPEGQATYLSSQPSPSDILISFGPNQLDTLYILPSSPLSSGPYDARYQVFPHSYSSSLRPQQSTEGSNFYNLFLNAGVDFVDPSLSARDVSGFLIHAVASEVVIHLVATG